MRNTTALWVARAFRPIKLVTSALLAQGRLSETCPVIHDHIDGQVDCIWFH